MQNICLVQNEQLLWKRKDISLKPGLSGQCGTGEELVMSMVLAVCSVVDIIMKC